MIFPFHGFSFYFHFLNEISALSLIHFFVVVVKLKMYDLISIIINDATIDLLGAKVVVEVNNNNHRQEEEEEEKEEGHHMLL